MTYNSNDSNSDFSSESEVEYEPILVEDAEGKKILMKEESNPLAPVVIVSTKASEKSTMKPKKIKVFATKDSMLSLIESVNSVQDGKIQAKLERDASYLQRLTNIEKATKERKSMKHERLDKIKDNLRKGGIRVKGENKRKVKEINEKKESFEGHGKKSFSSKSASSRGVPSKGNVLKSRSDSRSSSSRNGQSKARAPLKGGDKSQRKVKFTV